MADIQIALDKHLRAYLLANEPPEHEELRRLRERTAKLALARMQIAPEQGHFLGFLARLIGARRTLELGTFTGYSALAMALALPEKGRVVTCDINVEWDTRRNRTRGNRAFRSGLRRRRQGTIWQLLRECPAADPARWLNRAGQHVAARSGCRPKRAPRRRGGGATTQCQDCR